MHSSLISGVAELQEKERARAQERYIELLEHGVPDDVAELHGIAKTLGKSVDDIRSDELVVRHVSQHEAEILEANASGIGLAHHKACLLLYEHIEETGTIMAKREAIRARLLHDVQNKDEPITRMQSTVRRLAGFLSSNPHLFAKRKRVMLDTF